MSKWWPVIVAIFAVIEFLLAAAYVVIDDNEASIHHLTLALVLYIVARLELKDA